MQRCKIHVETVLKRKRISIKAYSAIESVTCQLPDMVSLALGSDEVIHHPEVFLFKRKDKIIISISVTSSFKGCCMENDSKHYSLSSRAVSSSRFVLFAQLFPFPFGGLKVNHYMSYGPYYLLH